MTDIDMGPVISAVQTYGDQRAAESEQAAHAEDSAQITDLEAQVADLQQQLADCEGGQAVDEADQALAGQVTDWTKKSKDVAGNEAVRQALLAWLAAKGLGQSVDPPTDPPAPALRFPGDPGPGRLYWGSSQDGSNIKDWTDFSAQCGGLGVCRRYYQSGDLAKLSSETAALTAVGALNAASFKVPGNDWAGVGAGKYDAWLGQVRDAVKAAGAPVLVCLHHEPYNGKTGTGDGGSMADFVAMYAHAAPILRGASNLVVMPIYNGYPFVDDSSGWASWAVDCDVAGVDIYPRKMTSKSQLVDKYKAGLDRLATFGKPMFLAEYGARDTVQGDYAAPMIRDLYDYLVARGDVVGASYFNSSKNVNVMPEAGPYWLAGDRLATFVECAQLATSARYAAT